MKLRRIQLKKLPPLGKIALPAYMMDGPSDRTMRSQRAYNKYRQSAVFQDCVFCASQELEVTKEYQYFRLTPSKFKYEIWDDHLVEEHLLLVPKRHLIQLNDFSADEKAEYLTLVGQFEADGYSFYSRAPSDTARSVTHFHTHFLRMSPEAIGSMVYVNKPHIMLYRKRK